MMKWQNESTVEFDQAVYWFGEVPAEAGGCTAKPAAVSKNLRSKISRIFNFGKGM